jgi:hypothetical protein
VRGQRGQAARFHAEQVQANPGGQDVVERVDHGEQAFRPVHVPAAHRPHADERAALEARAELLNVPDVIFDGPALQDGHRRLDPGVPGQRLAHAQQPDRLGLPQANRATVGGDLGLAAGVHLRPPSPPARGGEADVLLDRPRERTVVRVRHEASGVERHVQAVEVRAVVAEAGEVTLGAAPTVAGQRVRADKHGRAESASGGG